MHIESEIYSVKRLSHADMLNVHTAAILHYNATQCSQYAALFSLLRSWTIVQAVNNEPGYTTTMKLRRLQKQLHGNAMPTEANVM